MTLGKHIFSRITSVWGVLQCMVANNGGGGLFGKPKKAPNRDGKPKKM